MQTPLDVRGKGWLTIDAVDSRLARSPLERLAWLEGVIISRVSRRAARVAAFLTAHVNAIDGQCNASRKRISKLSGIGMNQVSEAISELREAGFIIAKNRINGETNYGLILQRNETIERSQNRDSSRSKSPKNGTQRVPKSGLDSLYGTRLFEQGGSASPRGYRVDLLAKLEEDPDRDQ